MFDISRNFGDRSDAPKTNREASRVRRKSEDVKAVLRRVVGFRAGLNRVESGFNAFDIGVRLVFLRRRFFLFRAFGGRRFFDGGRFRVGVVGRLRALRFRRLREQNGEIVFERARFRRPKNGRRFPDLHSVLRLFVEHHIQRGRVREDGRFSNRRVFALFFPERTERRQVETDDSGSGRIPAPNALNRRVKVFDRNFVVGD